MTFEPSHAECMKINLLYIAQRELKETHYTVHLMDRISATGAVWQVVKVIC